MVAADCPVIPVMFYTHTIVGSDRIKHLYVDPQKHAELGTAELAYEVAASVRVKYLRRPHGKHTVLPNLG